MFIRKLNLKIFIVLVFLGIIASLFILPYLHSFSGDFIKEAQEQLGLEGTLFNVLIIVQSSLMYSLAAFIGLLSYRKANFTMPLIEKYIAGEEVPLDLRSWINVSIGSGMVVAMLVIVGDFIFMKIGSPLSLLNSDLPVWWKGLLGAYSAAVGEEYIFRLMIMTVITLFLRKFFRFQHSMAVWGAIVISALFFGLMHIPATASLFELTPLLFIRAMLLNGTGAVIFGYLYWKRGLEAAIMAHFTADIIVHGLLQLIT
ncbi:MAG: CPBP family intramembrane metalloprotease [Tissierellales bacterium]|nr:CPBP family intramembrane metalloprotease [Tissierellales bacterium]MBN2826649.1 CPBP family intramembrane metalloprotease [Tissierellales bacterium]